MGRTSKLAIQILQLAVLSLILLVSSRGWTQAPDADADLLPAEQADFEDVQIDRPGGVVEDDLKLTGSAPANTILEVFVNGESRGLHRADNRGRFIVELEIPGGRPDAQIEVVRLGEAGQQLDSDMLTVQRHMPGAGSRLMAEFSGAVLVTLAGFFVGAITSAAIVQEDGLEGAAAALLGAGVGGTVAMPLGVYLGGNYAEGNGSLWATYLGAAAASGLWAATVIGLEANELAWTAPLCLFGGSVLGYELSNTDSPSREDATAGLWLAPTISVSEPGTREEISSGLMLIGRF